MGIRWLRADMRKNSRRTSESGIGLSLPLETAQPVPLYRTNDGPTRGAILRTTSMTVKSRLMLLMGTAIAGIVILLGLPSVTFPSVYKAANFGNTNTIPSIQSLGAAEQDRRAAGSRRGSYLRPTDAAWQAISRQNRSRRNALRQGFGRLSESSLDDEQDAADLAADREALAAYDTVRAQCWSFAHAGKKDEALALLLSPQTIINKSSTPSTLTRNTTPTWV